MKVLVVDDEQLVRWFLERALKKWGHEVTSVSNIQDAMTNLDGGGFDVLFTDLRMPDGNGTQLINQIETVPDVCKHIVVCSAFVTADMTDDFKSKGILTLKKPFKLAELESILSQCRV
jgi:DNA-binding NtrC family response regulator